MKSLNLLKIEKKRKSFDMIFKPDMKRGIN